MPSPLDLPSSVETEDEPGVKTSVSPTAVTTELCKTIEFDMNYSMSINRHFAEQFLLEEVSVWCVGLKEKMDSGIKVEYTHVCCMKRLYFSEHMLLWLHDIIKEGKSTLKITPAIERATRESVEAAIEYLSSVGVQTTLDAYKNYVFKSSDVGKPLTWYSKDRNVPVSRADHLLDVLMHNSILLRELHGCDVLHRLGKYERWQSYRSDNLSPVSLGGGSVAGHHVQDGFMHVVHVCVPLMWDKCLPEWLGDTSIPCLLDNEQLRTAVAVMNMGQKHAVQSWLFCSNVASVDGMKNLLQVLKEEGFLSTSDCQVVASWDCVINKREAVLNPEYMCSKYPELFREHLIVPGKGVVSNESHSVIGHSSFCMAWNLCLPSHMHVYAHMEGEMALAVRTNVIPGSVYGQSTLDPPRLLHGLAVNFCLTTELLEAADMIRAWPGREARFAS